MISSSDITNAFIWSCVFWSFQMCLVNARPKCVEGQYWDKHVSNCQSCANCCPPRPDNEFCRRRCNLKDICFPGSAESKNKNDAEFPFTYVVLGVGACFLVVLIATVIVVVKKLWATPRNASQLLAQEVGASPLIQETSPETTPKQAS